MRKFLFNAVFFGAIPAYMAMENFNWAWLIGYLILLVVVVFAHAALSLKTEVDAAFNIVVAHATLLTLDDIDKQKVKDHAKQMFAVYKCDPNAVFDNEIQELAHIALSMSNIGIKPAILFDKWRNVRNPSYMPSTKVIAHAMRIVETRIKLIAD